MYQGTQGLQRCWQSRIRDPHRCAQAGEGQARASGSGRVGAGRVELRVLQGSAAGAGGGVTDSVASHWPRAVRGRGRRERVRVCVTASARVRV